LKVGLGCNMNICGWEVQLLGGLQKRMRSNAKAAVWRRDRVPCGRRVAGWECAQIGRWWQGVVVEGHHFRVPT
jgi:hypothetical protein